MSKYPTNFKGQERLQPGARGEQFVTNMPGYRTNENRINRTNMKLSTTVHESPNIKYELDRRLEPLFRYGYSYGYNQIAVTKGRIMAADPAVNLLDYDTHKASNAITLANGGVPVVKKDDKSWEPVIGDAAYEAIKSKKENIYRALKTSVKSQMEGAKLSYDAKTGYLMKDGKVTADYRPANVPIGISIRNEYSRYDDAQNGMQPGGFNTDCMVELPMFLLQNKAEENPWGSIYGNLLPGDLVKSDANGRFTVSPLSRIDDFATEMTALEIERERQQVVGQIYSISRDLVPAGAAKYATWALSERMNFEEFNPLEYRQTNRDKEDVIDNSPHARTGGGAVNNSTDMTGKDPFEYPGYPYDRTISEHDLHMLASNFRNSSHRMQHEYQYENLGIPGLTDGYNAFVRSFPKENITKIYNRGDNKTAKYVDIYLRTAEVNLNSLKIQAGAGNAIEVKDNSVGQNVNDFLKIKYVNLLQGFVVLEVFDETKADAGIPKEGMDINAEYTKRGLAGIPTFMDWDGCIGTARILLQK